MPDLVDTCFEPETDIAALSIKQRQVLDLVLEHKSNKEIARILSISPSAVDQRLALARMKLGTKSRGETARAYASMRTTCVKHTGLSAQVATGEIDGNRDLEDETVDSLEFADIGITHEMPMWANNGLSRIDLRDVAVPASPWVRLGLIILFALLIAVVALIGMSVTQGSALLAQ